MAFYDSNSINMLQDKLDYETWLLEDISFTLEVFKGMISSKFFYYNNISFHPTSVADESGAAIMAEFIRNLSPLTFITCYKILDVIFEWILEEHQRNREISTVPWTSMDRINTIKSMNRNGTLKYPPIMYSKRFIFDYAFKLYENLRIFRNEIVHDKNFHFTSGILKITKNRSSIEINKDQMGAFVRSVVSIANMLLGNIPLESKEEKLLKYYLDQIKNLHKLSLFTEKEPLLLEVFVSTHLTGGKYPVDLKSIKNELVSVFPGMEIFFNLIVIGLVGNKPLNFWFFNYDALPEQDILELNLVDYTDNIISLDKFETFIPLKELESINSRIF